jgi:hypothetical protein
MKIRELLRYEIWSKETSREILSSVWKFLKLSAIAWVVSGVLAGIVFVVEAYCLTGGERRAGRAALGKIEEVEKLVDCDCELFATAYGQANIAVEEAGRKAWTLRDHQTEEELSLYLWEIEQRHTMDIHEKLLSEQRHLKTQLDARFEEQRRSSDFQLFETSRSTLHKILD